MNDDFAINRFKVWLAWLTMSIFLAYQYALRVMPNVIMPYLEDQFHINASQFGQFSGIYYIGYTVMHIPLGIMLDRIGPRWVVSSCLLLIVIGFLPLIYSDSWGINKAGRVLVGVASSAGILGVFKVIRMGFPSEKFPFILGISITIGFMGGSYGGQLISYFANIVGLKLVIKCIIGIGCVLSIVSMISLPSNKVKKNIDVLGDLRCFFANGKLLVVACLGGLMVGPIEGFADGWASTFLRVVYPQLDDFLLVFLPSLILLGLAFGAPALGYIATKVGNYYRLIAISGVAMLIPFILIFLQIQYIPILFVAFVTIGFFSAYQTLVIHKACTLVPESLVGLTTACTNMIIMIFGYFFHTSIGEVIELSSIDGYTAQSLIIGTSVIPICLFLSSCAFVYLSIKDR